MRAVTILAVCFLLAGCLPQSDEQLIRREFAVPARARMTAYSASPEQGGWFGREGLRIHMEFQFTTSGFNDYLAAARRQGGWRELPIPRRFLLHMGGIESAKQGILRSFALQNKTYPEGSVYNPTQEQLYEQFVKRLDLQVRRGLFQCRTAGDNIMHAEKRTCQELRQDLNDYMLAVLDRDAKRLIIKVGTKY